MRQRLGLADALVKQPSILILDEPTVNIDPEGVRELLALVERLSDEQGVTVILSSHLLHQVEQVCDRIGIFVKGRLVALGTVDELAVELDEVDVRRRRRRDRRSGARSRRREGRRVDRGRGRELVVVANRDVRSDMHASRRRSRRLSTHLVARAARTSTRSTTGTSTKRTKRTMTTAMSSPDVEPGSVDDATEADVAVDRSTGAGGGSSPARSSPTTSVRSRFVILLVLVSLAGLAAGALGERSDPRCRRLGDADAVDLPLLFTLSPERVPAFHEFLGILGPLLGIAFGFDAINGERAQRTLPRLVAQPIHRDEIINGKFVGRHRRDRARPAAA